MKEVQRNEIRRLRMDGKGYATIAKATGLSKESMKGFCKRNGLGGVAAALSSDGFKVEPNKAVGKHGSSSVCPYCGKPISQTLGRKPRRFCSDACRVKWWNSHPEAVNRKAVYSFICLACGRPFSAYGNAKRKYCCHDCFIQDHFKGGATE